MRNECSLIVELLKRGRGQSKRYWVIEMNHVRCLYISTYHGTDVIDHLTKTLPSFAAHRNIGIHQSIMDYLLLNLFYDLQGMLRGDH